MVLFLLQASVESIHFFPRATKDVIFLDQMRLKWPPFTYSETNYQSNRWTFSSSFILHGAENH